MALRLFAVTLLEGLHGESPAEGTELLPVRELAAVVEEAPYVMSMPDEATLDRHHGVISDVFSRGGAVLPAPVGTVFREHRALQQWLELHYVALSDALAFVEDRAEARVHVSANGLGEDHEPSDDVATLASECFRVLRRQAVASLKLRTERGSAGGMAVSTAFLVDRTLWKEFAALAEEERARHTGLDVDVTGPWPPYDFVRIHFAG